MGFALTPWKGDVTPFKILGNLYFVGTEGASTHILDTGEGLIMFDSGYQESLYLVIHHMNMLGLDIRNVKYIFHTHGHIDHAGATAAIKRMIDTKAVIGKEDREYVNGERDLSYAKELCMEMIFFEPDILLSEKHIGDEKHHRRGRNCIGYGDHKIVVEMSKLPKIGEHRHRAQHYHKWQYQ